MSSRTPGLLLRTFEERQRIQQPANEQFRRPLISVDLRSGAKESRLGGVSGLEISGEEAPEVSRQSQIQWPTREQVETALAEHETQAQVTAALGLRIHQLRAAIERVGLEWPWQGAGRPRLDRVPEPASTADKPEPEPDPDPKAVAMMQDEAELRAELQAADAAAADVGDEPLGPPPELPARRVDRSGRTVADGLTISLPRTTLDQQAANRLLGQVRDTITVVGGPVELSLSVRVGVGGRG